MMDKLGVGLIVCMAVAAGCGKPELGLGDLEGEAGAGGSTNGAGGSTQGGDDGTGGKRTQDGTGSAVQDGTGGKSVPNGTGGDAQDGGGGDAQDGSGGNSSPGGSGQGGTGGTSPEGGSGGSAQPEAGNGGKGQPDPGCTALSESECERSQGCSPIYGSDDGTLSATVFDVFAGCLPSGTACPAVTQCAYPAGAPDRCLVISGCLPEGWSADTDCSAQGCRQQPGTGGSGGGSGSAGAGNDCALATAEELAATPREDPNLEQLAASHSDGIVADQAVYDRVVRDITMIREEAEDISGIDYWPPNDGKTLLLMVDAATFEAMQADSYADWDCLLDSYPVDDIQYEEHTHDRYVVQIVLRGIYRLDPIAAQFAELSGVSSALPDFFIGDGPTLCLTPSDSVWHYVFDQASGDCLAGCIAHSYTYFTVSSDGATIERVGSWGTGSASSPAPDWVAEYASMEACR
ncbi:MAG: hypothetical protein JW940_08935 [Polyangiaceae bacterium]|nr:hypothetical protein [Polyangiaceae bacterium]